MEIIPPSQVIDALKWRYATKSFDTSRKIPAETWAALAVPTSVGEAEIDRFLQTTADTRGVDVSTLDGFRKMMVGFVVQGMDSAQQKDWAIRQVYIALGQFMLATAMVGIDACPMEGFIPAKYDEVLGLAEKDLTAAVVCPVGYRDASDKHATLPKVRYDKADMLSHI